MNGIEQQGDGVDRGRGFALSRDAFGRLVFQAADGAVVAGVVPVRAFPITAPDAGIAVVAPDGRELAWVDRIAELEPAIRALVEEELAEREFSPRIQRIVGVSGFVTPCTWEVETDRGAARFVLKGEEFIRRLANGALLIADSNGVQWTVESIAMLDRVSRRILDRFL